MPEIRFDPLTGRQVIIAIERSKRPTDLKGAIEEEILDEFIEGCPFCPGNESKTPPETFRISVDDEWKVRVIPNKFPALALDSNCCEEKSKLYRMDNGIGIHEVIIENRKHNGSFFNITKEEYKYIIEAYKERYKTLIDKDNIQYVNVFKNYKKKAGASLEHSHSQIIASALVPYVIEEEILRSREYFNREKNCIFCDILKAERESNKRVITDNDSFTALCPYASKYNYEVLIMPNNHNSNFEKINDKEIEDLADILKHTFDKMYKILGDFPFNMFIHSLPKNMDSKDGYHWHLEIVPRTSTHAGFEIGSGVYINSTPPEEGARLLREI